jgi:hypothetical protein
VTCSHRITLSALASTFGGIVRPICLHRTRQYPKMICSENRKIFH